MGHALRDYLDWKRLAATRSHFETLVSLVNHHLVPRVSHLVLETFNGDDFHRLVHSVIETPPKIGRQARPPQTVQIEELTDEQLRRRKKTVNALVSILRGAFDIAWERERLTSDRPMRCLRRLPNFDRPRIVFLDRAECQRLLDASELDLRDLILGALYTGCRPGELISMRVEDLGRASSSVYIAKPKGRRSRHIFLPEEGLRFFLDLAGNRHGSDRLFRKTTGQAWGGEYKSQFARARSRARLPPRLTFHGLRHTYASQLIQAGASLLLVADQLGHANTQTVSSTYGHLATQDRQREIDRRFERLLAEPVPAPGNVRDGGRSDLPRLINPETTSWPRSNFSRFSGPLLGKLLNSATKS